MVRIWKDDVRALDLGDEAADWLSQLLGRECRLSRPVLGKTGHRHASCSLRRPSRIRKMLVQGFTGGAFVRIIGGLQSSYFAALLVVDVVVLERVPFRGAIGNTQ